MHTHTINTAAAKKLVAASAISNAFIVGQPGGWSVVLKTGLQEKPLGAQRSDKPRTWRSLDRCVDYLKNDLNITRIDMLDATNHSDVSPTGSIRADAAERMRETHAAAAYNRWLQTEVQAAIDSPRPRVSNEEAMQHFADRRDALKKRILEGQS